LSNKVEYLRMLWNQRGSHGPDVEAVMLIPIAVAVESKRTSSVALKEIGQVINYVESGLYDSVFINIEDEPSQDDEDFKRLLNHAQRLGVGILVGGEEYSAPHQYGEKQVRLKAVLDLQGDPLALLQERQKYMLELRVAEESTESYIGVLSSYRRIFFNTSGRNRGGN